MNKSNPAPLPLCLCRCIWSVLWQSSSSLCYTTPFTTVPSVGSNSSPPTTTTPLLIDSSASSSLPPPAHLIRPGHLAPIPSVPTNHSQQADQRNGGDAAGACPPAGGRGGGVAAAGGGGGGQLHGGRREGVEPRRGLHGLGEEAQALLQGRLAHLPVPERSVGRGAGGRGRVRQLRQGQRAEQLQQGQHLRLPAQGGQRLLLHLQLWLLLPWHEGPCHRQVLRLFLLRIRLRLLLFR